MRAFIGAMELENAPARRCVEGAGFTVAERADEEGMLRIMRAAS